MIRFRCHRCKRPIAAPDGYVGKKVKCPGCMIVTIVPDIPGAQAAKAKQRPESTPAPQPAQRGPRGPLDELAAAVEGEVETASFDEEYPEDADARRGRGEGPRGAGRRRVSGGRKPQTANIVLWTVLLLLVAAVAVGIVLVINRRGAGL